MTSPNNGVRRLIGGSLAAPSPAHSPSRPRRRSLPLPGRKPTDRHSNSPCCTTATVSRAEARVRPPFDAGEARRSGDLTLWVRHMGYGIATLAR